MGVRRCSMIRVECNAQCGCETWNSACVQHRFFQLFDALTEVVQPDHFEISVEGPPAGWMFRN